MDEKILNHYSRFGMFTYPGLYENYFRSLPDNVPQLGHLIRHNFIHRTTLDQGNTGTNEDLKYGDMTKVPWWRQAEDDNLPTAVAMIAELFRRDPEGLTMNRSVENKLVLTCRYVSILMASILKSKGIPTRVRSGFAGYFEGQKIAWDHWVNQYWSTSEHRWITIDVDGSLHRTGFDMYDIPEGKFEWSAQAWLAIREGKRDGKYFNNSGGFNGLITIAWEIFYDFHSLMNNEIIYMHGPKMVSPALHFKKITEKELMEIDILARLMTDPDKNFDELINIYNTKKEFRLLSGSLL
jgi:hypothetical protein